MMYGTSDTMQMARETSGIEFFWVYSTGDRGGWMIKEAIAWMRTSGNANLVLLLCIIYIYSYIIKSKTARAAYLLFFFFLFILSQCNKRKFFFFIFFGYLFRCTREWGVSRYQTTYIHVFICLCVCVFMCIYVGIYSRGDMWKRSVDFLLIYCII